MSYTYDDVQLIPKYSNIASRQEVDISSYLTKNKKLTLPFIASPMDTVCETMMASILSKNGGIGCIHRFMSIEEQSNMIKVLKSSNKDNLTMAAIGANGDYLERAHELYQAGADFLLIDVAHGHHENVKNALSILKSGYDIKIIAGNIATGKAAVNLSEWGADCLRVGIGGGSLCTTRIQTGFGIPNITTIINVSEALQNSNFDTPIIADGGIRSSGDIAKALAAGADTVMLGSLLAGTFESPGDIMNNGNKRYRGSASLETKVAHGQKERNVEGASTEIKYKGTAEKIINSLADGVKSAFSYMGARNISEYHSKAEFVYVTNAGIIEAKPHLIS
jgi:IMP dehydrogenase